VTIPGALEISTAETTQIYARDGKTLLYQMVDPEGGQRTVVEFGRIPHMTKDATIAVDDLLP